MNARQRFVGGRLRRDSSVGEIFASGHIVPATSSSKPASAASWSSATAASDLPPAWQYPPTPFWPATPPWPPDAPCDPPSQSLSRFQPPPESVCFSEPLRPPVTSARHRIPQQYPSQAVASAGGEDKRATLSKTTAWKS